jgi:hypothetical protein
LSRRTQAQPTAEFDIDPSVERDLSRRPRLEAALGSLEQVLHTVETIQAAYGDRPSGLRRWLEHNVERLVENGAASERTPSLEPVREAIATDAARLHAHTEAALSAEAQAVADALLEAHSANIREALAGMDDAAVLVVDRRSPGLPDYLLDVDSAVHIGPRDAIARLVAGLSPLAADAVALGGEHVPVVVLTFGRVLLTTFGGDA